MFFITHESVVYVYVKGDCIMKPVIHASDRHHQVLSRLSLLPRKILALYQEEHVSEFVLHELCNKQCFDMTKAAYFVDNPDFDCLQGIAGYSQEEHNGSGQEFSDHLSACHFNRKVQAISCPSYKRAKKLDTELLKDVAGQLNFKSPRCYTWQLKHDNQGVLVYELATNSEDLNDCIQNALHLLGFCSLN